MKLYLRQMYPIIRTEKLSAEEKTKLRDILRKRLLIIGSIYFIVIAASISIIFFFNTYSTIYYIENNLEIINVVFVIIAALSGRMLITEIMDCNKEVNASEKKIVETTITAKKENKITIGNKHFSKHDFIMDNSSFDDVQEGDRVRIDLSIKSGMLFSIKRI